MKNHLVVASWGEDNYITAMATADTVERANELVSIMVSEGNVDAFHAPHPTGSHDTWVVDPVAKTVTDGLENPAEMVRRWIGLRAERNAFLAESDWTQGVDSPLTDEVKASWATYREELRALPESVEDPANPVWPEAPE